MLLLLGLSMVMAADEGVFLSRHVAKAPPLVAGPANAAWRKAPLVIAAQDRFGRPLPEARTEA